MSIAENIRRISATLPEGVALCAVSKFHPIEALKQAYEAGQRVFGESRVQELLAKIPQMPDDVRWHFIGHLQTNKVRQIIGHTAMIESVDSERLLRLINSESERAGVTTNILMQLHVAAEETKFGFSPEELIELFRSRKYQEFRFVKFCGVMGMATNTDSTERILADFRTISDTLHVIKEIAPELTEFNSVSMGMSDDYPLAIDCGSTMVRVGTGIFGSRGY